MAEVELAPSAQAIPMDETKVEIETEASNGDSKMEEDPAEEAVSKSEFTSEVFKVEINGLPKFFGVGQMKKLFGKFKLNYHKIKPAGRNASYMFVNFTNEADREKAITVLTDKEVKGRMIKVRELKHTMAYTFIVNIHGSLNLIPDFQSACGQGSHEKTGGGVTEL